MREEDSNTGRGVTPTERYLAKLCRRSFLSLWSYPAVYRNQGRCHGKGDGKEVCDLLVVFENHISIFSDKDCRFSGTNNLEAAWGRWYKNAILKSALQVWGAERWIKQFRNTLVLDRQCTTPFPISLPDAANAIFHRIVVAHDSGRYYRKILSGSGSLMLDSTLVGDAHLQRPFTIGQINPEKGYVHVFDDTTLDIVMSTLDTITDFTRYLVKKEQFLTSNKKVLATGEEELLAVYLMRGNENGEHDFVIEGEYDTLCLLEGGWDGFTQNPQRKEQLKRDRISYAWDMLIEKFAFHTISKTEHFTTGGPLSEQEIMFRFMAREPRTRRRMLAISLGEVLERSIKSDQPWDARITPAAGAAEPYYVFLFVKHPPDASDADYRNMRMELLHAYCVVTKLKYPQAKHIVGIASDGEDTTQRSEDLFYLDASDWSAEAQSTAIEIQQRLGILKEVKLKMHREYDYPIDHTGKLRDPALSRNSLCPCGSRQRFKRCCGKEIFDKRHRGT